MNPTTGRDRSQDPGSSKITYSVRNFGASGTGEVKDTDALQKTIDACHANGGGTVLLPPGRYLSGTIYLKSNVDFHLVAGATLVASADQDDYNAEDAFAENRDMAHENVSAAHLIVCYRQEDVAITGRGTIHGNSEAFYEPLPEGKEATFRGKTYAAGIKADWRPSQLVHFCISRHIVVRDVTIVDAPFTNLFLQACEHAQVRGITITQPPASHSDGIVVDFSQNVTISDCRVTTGDDCICIFTRRRDALGDAAVACRNVTVSNCILQTACNAIRLGVGDGEISNCAFSNIVIPESRTAISIVSRWSDRIPHGSTVEQVRFSNIVADACMPFVIDVGPGAARPGAIRDVSLNGLSLRASAGSQLVGSPEVPLERIRFSDVDWHIRGGTEDLSYAEEFPERPFRSGYSGVGGGPALPCIMYATRVEGLALEDVRVRWDSISRVWRDGFFIENSSDVSLTGLRMRQPQDSDGAAVRSRANTGVTVRNCRAEVGTGVFLLAEASPAGARIRCGGNDMADARVPAQSDVPFEPFHDFLDTGNAGDLQS